MGKLTRKCITPDNTPVTPTSNPISADHRNLNLNCTCTGRTVVFGINQQCRLNSARCINTFTYKYSGTNSPNVSIFLLFLAHALLFGNLRNSPFAASVEKFVVRFGLKAGFSLSLLVRVILPNPCFTLITTIIIPHNTLTKSGENNRTKKKFGKFFLTLLSFAAM